MGFNVVSDSVTQWLSGVAESYQSPLLAAHLVAALHRPLCKILAAQTRSDNLVRIESLPAGSPGWLQQAFHAGDPPYVFRPALPMQDDIRHVADWIAAALVNEAAWLRQCDGRGRPHKLLKLGSLEQAVSEADKAMRIAAVQAAALAETEGHLEIVKIFSDGTRIVRLLTPAALDDDSRTMGHCIGNGAYDRFLEDSSRQYFSLRTRGGRTCATMEVDMDSEPPLLLQCKGRQNRPPVSRYFPYIRNFVTEQRLRLHGCAAMTGMVEQDGVYYDICHLPENFHYRGDLDLSYTFVTHLPDGLRVDGRLDIQYTDVSALPERLSVQKGLTAHNTRIRVLTREATDGIKGGIFAGDNIFESLPDEWVVDGDLYLVGAKLSAFPQNLTVKGNLNMFRCVFPGFSEGLKVGGSLTTEGGRLPLDTEVGGRIITERTVTAQEYNWAQLQRARFAPD